MPDKYVDVRISGNEMDLNSLLRGLAYISTLGRIGAHRTVAFHVDGDGSGRISFKDLNGNIDFQMYSHKDIPEPGEGKDVHAEINVHVGE